MFSQEPQFIPQLVLLFVIVFALTHSLVETLWVSFLAGFFEELFSGIFFGAHIWAFVLTGVVIYLITRNLTAEEIKFPTALFLVALASVFYVFAIYAYDSALNLLEAGNIQSLHYYFPQIFFLEIVLNIVLFFPIRAVYKLVPK